MSLPAESTLENWKAVDADFAGVRAIFFDLDDTLCNYWSASKKALRQTFSDVPVEGFSVDRMVQLWATAFREFAPLIKKTHWYEIYLKDSNPTRVEQMRRTLELIGIRDLTLAQKLGDLYRDYRFQNLELFEDAKAVLQELKGKYPLGLITNGPADFQRKEIQVLGLEDTFESVWIEGELGYGKPDPNVFQNAISAGGFHESETLMVGNSYEHDIRQAIAEGWKTAWIRRPTDVPPSANDDAIPESLPEGATPPDSILLDLRVLLPQLLA